MILESYAQQMGMRRVLVFLQNYGISPNLAMRIAKYYGEKIWWSWFGKTLTAW